MLEEKNNNRNTINYIITIINIVKQQAHKKNIFCVRLKNYLLLNWISSSWNFLPKNNKGKNINEVTGGVLVFSSVLNNSNIQKSVRKLNNCQ